MVTRGGRAPHSLPIRPHPLSVRHPTVPQEATGARGRLAVLRARLAARFGRLTGAPPDPAHTGARGQLTVRSERFTGRCRRLPTRQGEKVRTQNF